MEIDIQNRTISIEYDAVGYEEKDNNLTVSKALLNLSEGQYFSFSLKRTEKFRDSIIYSIKSTQQSVIMHLPYQIYKEFSNVSIADV